MSAEIYSLLPQGALQRGFKRGLVKTLGRMPDMIILAHRGWWDLPEHRNTLGAFERAFTAGYGVELDVRDSAGKLVISHDPPRAGAVLLETVLRLYADCGAPGRLAINVKSDGLCAEIDAAVKDAGVAHKAFVFDMSVPDMRGYFDCSVDVFTRFSDAEPNPSFYERCSGVWIDSFDGAWASAERALFDLSAGKAAALVSPELHRRPFERAWESWSATLARAAPQATSPDLMICTDFPDLAERAFANRTEEAVM